MRVASPSSRAAPAKSQPWRRRNRRAWTRRDSRTTVLDMLAAIPSLPRAELARITARLVDHMREIESYHGDQPDQNEEHSHE